MWKIPDAFHLVVPKLWHFHSWHLHPWKYQFLYHSVKYTSFHQKTPQISSIYWWPKYISELLVETKTDYVCEPLVLMGSIISLVRNWNTFDSLMHLCSASKTLLKSMILIISIENMCKHTINTISTPLATDSFLTRKQRSSFLSKQFSFPAGCAD